MKKGQLEIDEQQNKMQVLLSILPFKEYKIFGSNFANHLYSVQHFKRTSASFEIRNSWGEIAIEPSSTIMRLYLGRSKEEIPMR